MTTNYVYRAFDASGLLLYIGCSKDVAKRLAQHRSQATWAPYMDRFTVEDFPDRDAALAAESAAICAERPFFNAQPEHTAMVQANRVKAIQAVHDLLDAVGIEAAPFEDEGWWQALYNARSAVQELIQTKFPVVRDSDRHQVYLAAREAKETAA